MLENFLFWKFSELSFEAFLFPDENCKNGCVSLLFFGSFFGEQLGSMYLGGLRSVIN